MAHPAPPADSAATATADEAGPRVAFWRGELRERRAVLREAFFARPDTARLLREHARLVDAVIRGIWSESAMPVGLAALAVGGYGRGQLFPHSDVDVLILMPHADAPPATAIERFFATLWDIGIELSHAVRTIEECIVEMKADVTIETSLLEHRLLAGSCELFRRFRAQFAAHVDIRVFYDAKALEQQQRHLKYQDAIYNLEPNVKESPGGLRDLASVLWIARAAGFGKTWRELARNGLMTAGEARAASRQERLIGALRVRLHYLMNRREDRLVFDAQSALAEQLGLADTRAKRASEQLMQRYYRAAILVRQLNTLLLQNLSARIYPTAAEPLPIDAEFQQVDELLDLRDERVFERRPGAILDAFLLLQRHRELKGMTARTLRALWHGRRLIDGAFRRDAANRERFIEMFRIERGLLHGLRRMNLYGILGQYLPVFGRIVGQMQHDLFHVDTVDEHILMVIRNLRRFTEAQHAHEYPLCSRLIADFERRELLYVAGLFHDIAKGRGGDHSALGARDARRFCRAHALSAEDTELVAWLVTDHLLMSSTAQKQDLSDPDVIAAFARRMGNERRLIALYLFTVADIRGTSPKVWNNWKGKLLEDLFHAARAVLAGTAPARTVTDSVEARRLEAQRLLRLYAVPEGSEQKLWKWLDTPYFQRHTAEEIAWHARHLYWRVERSEPVVKARLARDGAGMQVLVYLPDQKELFARLCGFFGRTGLSILEAKIHTTRNGRALDTFALHDPAPSGTSYRDTLQMVEFELSQLLAEQPPLAPPQEGRIPRLLKHFPLTPEVQIFPDDKGTHYILEVVAGDRPGLLARVAYTLARANVNVVSAKINTLGDRAEDVFLIDGAPLHDGQALLRLETALYEELKI
ncbi:MAG: [protein-PII] uridylyltransferase [Burkholderiales bacterium]|nr:[protein-PII] uridylyltransferase [Burkholderiales bacterium]